MSEKKLILPFTQEAMTTKFAATPQSTLFWNLIGYPHDEFSGSGMQRLQRTLEKLVAPKGFTGWLERMIFVETAPRTLDEEELMHLVNLRGPFQRLYGISFDRASIPEEIKKRFSDNATKNATNDYQYNSGRMLIIQDLSAWWNDHQEQDVPIPIDQEMQQGLDSLYSKTESLVGFYDQKRPLITDEEYNKTKGIASLRYEVVHNLLFMLDPAFPIKKMRNPVY